MVVQLRFIQRQLVVKQDRVPAGQQRPRDLLAAHLPLWPLLRRARRAAGAVAAAAAAGCCCCC